MQIPVILVARSVWSLCILVSLRIYLPLLQGNESYLELNTCSVEHRWGQTYLPELLTTVVQESQCILLSCDGRRLRGTKQYGSMNDRRSG